jgi:hypothetical protein
VENEQKRQFVIPFIKFFHFLPLELFSESENSFLVEGQIRIKNLNVRKNDLQSH